MANFLVDHEYTLDITPSARPQLVHVSEYDVGRIFTFTLKHNGEEMTIPSSYGAVTVEGTIGSYAFSEPASIENGKIVFQLTESMTAHAGKAWTKIKFANADAPVSTCAFWLVVDRAGVEAETITGAPGFEEQIAEAAGAWLEEQGFQSPTVDVTEITGGHRVTVTDYQGSESFDVMDGEDTGVVTDTTLTVSGAAADSKTVGDILGAGEYALGDPDNWVRQIILDGERQSSETRIATKDYLPTNVTHIVCASGYSALIHRYTLNGEHAGFWGGSSFVTTGSGIYRQEFDIPQDSYRYVLVLKKNDNATITTNAAVNITSDADGESTEGLIQRVSALESSNVYKAVDDFESGAIWTVNGALTAEYGMYAKYRRQVHMLEIGTAPVKISVGSTDAALVQTVSGYFYDSAFALLERQSGNTLSTDGTLLLTPPTGAKYLKYTFVLTADSDKKVKNVEFSSHMPLRVVKNANIPHPSYGNMYFDYPVGKSHRTSGQLILPPNYSVDGDPVPLYVQVHGTGAMSKWDTRLGINGSTDSRYLSQYMANEGFAVFDCYPWTDKHYSTSAQISPYVLPIHQKAYLDGIRYVCDRFNVDIDNVCLSFKSLGGHLGYWFMSEAELPVKALAMLAPSAVWWAMFWDEYFYSTQATRSSIVSALGLTGKPNADAFIQYGKMANANARAFVEDNLIAFASVAPAACDTHGATYQEFYDWMVTRATAKPQWMADLGLPDFPANRSVPQLIEHPELTKHSLYPVKYWMAWDDINTSTHVAYTVYQWLKNSGSDAQWETVPDGTGAHHAIDTDPNAEKLSGTTRLGIAYSGIAKTYVQMADFFYDKM